MNQIPDRSDQLANILAITIKIITKNIGIKVILKKKLINNLPLRDGYLSIKDLYLFFQKTR